MIKTIFFNLIILLLPAPFAAAKSDPSVLSFATHPNYTGNHAFLPESRKRDFTIDSIPVVSKMFSIYQDSIVTKDSTDSWTASWVDVNNDGYDDLFVTDKRSNFPNKLYINNKAGGFTRSTGANWLVDTCVSVSNTWADVDNDGNIDVLITTDTRKPNLFYRGDGKGNFIRDKTEAFTKSVSYYHGAAFADYDNDGKVDLFVCNYLPIKSNELYHNNGQGVFIQEFANAIPEDANQSTGPTWADYDGDGFQDLFVPDGTGFKNSLFHNEGNGLFTKAQNVITSEGGNSVGSCWGDYDNDGDLDLFVTNANAIGNFLYRNDGNGNFTKITTGFEVTDKSNSHGCSFADIDNDGDLDLYVTSDTGDKLLYLNNGDGTFTKDTTEPITANFGKSYAHAWSDFDHDGDLDLFVPTHSNNPNFLFINNGNSNSWLEINLVGINSNRSAIGADIYVLANGKWQMREVNAQSGFGGQSSLTQHFGLGSASMVDSIKIKWPGGAIQVLTGVAVKQIMNVTELKSAKISGGVFLDKNNNGIKDPGELMVPGAAIQVSPGNTKLYTNNAGYFNMYAGTGTYSFNVIAQNYIRPAANNAPSRTIINTQDVTDSVWLPALADCNFADLSVMMGGTAMLEGYSNNQLSITVTNNGNSNAGNYLLKFKAPATINLNSLSDSIANTVISIVGNTTFKTYTWNMSGLNSFASHTISFKETNTGLNVGDTVSVIGWVEGVPNDCTLANNSISQTYKVAGGVYPNEIQVAPVGYGATGLIPAAQQLTYTVVFQNIGNHPVSSAIITDTLPEGLDLTTLQVVGQSHPNMSVLINGQQVKFEFDSIFLSDSASNYAYSNGYIVFSVFPKQGIAAGTTLTNGATIQFDHYIPVQTNTVLNTIESIQLANALEHINIYPNPAVDKINVTLFPDPGSYSSKKIQSAELLDVAGRVLLKKSGLLTNEIQIDIPDYMIGCCFVKLIDSDGAVYVKKILLSKKM